MNRWRLAVAASVGRKRSWSHPWHRWLGLAAIGVMLGALLMGCTIDQQTLQRDPFMRDMMSLQNQVDQPHKMGQSFDVGNTTWKINAAHAALALQLGAKTVKAQGKFVVIDFTFTNTTGQPQNPTTDMLTLEDAQLKTYQSDTNVTALLSAWQKTPNFLKDVFQSNKAYDCSIVFELPVETSGLTLQFQSFPTPGDSSSLGM